ncbi:Exocyst complex component SEC3 [Lachnellula cervina]|uniref:Exocyst complex component SEC3 n=1 Tax=Lachnellula cervina TaxID=1316786 RepID=A0A7D8USN7_9HELO|nr:Exocyst complex component SEC3 [Lachnellula cervina]
MYQNHLKHRHPLSFVEDQIPALLEMSQKPMVKISPADCPFCDDWEKRLRDVNKHIPLSETLVVTPTHFKHHVGAHMEQLALFAIPRGYTEDGEADSGNAAPDAGSEGSSLSLSTPDSIAAMDLRACEDFLIEMMDNGLLDAYFKSPSQTCRPTLEEISQALGSGRYSNAASFTKDFRQMFDQFTHDIRRKKFANSAFTEVEMLEEMTELRLEFIAFCRERQITSLTAPTSPTQQWKRWRAERIPGNIYSPKLASKQPGILVNCRLDNGQMIQGWFESTALIDDVLAFVECYELLHEKHTEHGLTLDPKPVGYDHQYQFGLAIEGSEAPLKDSLLSPKMTLSFLFGSMPGGKTILSVVLLPQPTMSTEPEKGESKGLSEPKLPLAKAVDRLPEVPNLRLTIFGINGPNLPGFFRVPELMATIIIDDHEAANTNVVRDWNPTWNENFYVHVEESSSLTISIDDQRTENDNQGGFGHVRFGVGDMIDLSGSQEKKFTLVLKTTTDIINNLAGRAKLSIGLSTDLGLSKRHLGSEQSRVIKRRLLRPVDEHSTDVDVEKEEEASLSAGREEKTNIDGGAEGDSTSFNIQLDSAKSSPELNNGDEGRRVAAPKNSEVAESPSVGQPSDTGSATAGSREKSKGSLRNLVSKVFRPLSSRFDSGSIAGNISGDKSHVDYNPFRKTGRSSTWHDHNDIESAHGAEDETSLSNVQTNKESGNDPLPSSRAMKFENEKRRLINSCFSEGKDGIVKGSYITHIKVTEDDSFLSSPPPPTANPNMKARLIVISVRNSGRVCIHKARENIDGTFSIGKTWRLDDLTAIKSFDIRTEESFSSVNSSQDLQDLQWAGDVGFTLVLGKPYYWQAESVKEKQFFIASLVKIYAKYTRGEVPELIGFDSKEREQILGVPAAAPPLATDLNAKVQEGLDDGEVQGQINILQASLNREMTIMKGDENLLESLNTKKATQTKEKRHKVEAELNESNRKIKLLRNQISELQTPKPSSTPTASSTMTETLAKRNSEAEVSGATSTIDATAPRNKPGSSSHTPSHHDHSQGGSSKGKQEQERGGTHWEWFWLCCGCQASMIPVYTEACTNVDCNHLRCENCSMESLKVPNMDPDIELVWPDDPKLDGSKDDLLTACHKGLLDIAQQRLEEGPQDLHETDSGLHTPLHIASMKGHTDIVRLLLNYGSNVNSADRSKDTPLHDAIRYGHIEIVKLLLDAGANPYNLNSRGDGALDYIVLDNENDQFYTREEANEIRDSIRAAMDGHPDYYERSDKGRRRRERMLADWKPTEAKQVSQETVAVKQEVEEEVRFLDAADTTSPEIGHLDNYGLAWPIDRVLSWLDTNGFSTEWQESFKGLDICGSRFLELGNSRKGKGNLGVLHQQIYPRLEKECSVNGTGWDPAREREEGDRLRQLIHIIATGREANFLKKIGRPPPQDTGESSRKHLAGRTMVVKYIPPTSAAAVGTCSVCGDVIKQGTYMQAVPCEHMFHDTCSTAMQGHNTSDCPICNIRPPREVPDLDTHSSDNPVNVDQVDSGKMKEWEGIAEDVDVRRERGEDTGPLPLVMGPPSYMIGQKVEDDFLARVVGIVGGCNNGYTYVKVEGGYRCGNGTGSHFAADESVLKEYTARSAK